MSPRSSNLLIAGLCVALLAACAPTALSATSPASKATAQERFCGRLDDATCGQVIAAVRAQIPENKTSPIAVADYATAARPSASGPTGMYLVAFAPLPGEDVWMNPPTWFVSGAAGTWTLTPAKDVAGLNVCFIELLGRAGLTNYAPTFPSGVCG